MRNHSLNMLPLVCKTDSGLHITKPGISRWCYFKIIFAFIQNYTIYTRLNRYAIKR